MSSVDLWYATRASGLTALVLLSATTVIGVATARRQRGTDGHRFAVAWLHRRLSGLSVAFVVVHVLTTILDSYVSVGWAAAIFPLASPYRRLSVALGTVAFDLLLAVGITSVLRGRMHPRSWRAIHWLAYASWPVAVLHGIVIGTDMRLRWVLGLVAMCLASVVIAGVIRLVSPVTGAHAVLPTSGVRAFSPAKVWR